MQGRKLQCMNLPFQVPLDFQRLGPRILFYELI